MTLAKLEELAKAATPGPFEVSKWGTIKPGFPHMPVVKTTGHWSPDENAAFLAALTPQVVLALLDCAKACSAMGCACDNDAGYVCPACWAATQIEKAGVKL